MSHHDKEGEQEDATPRQKVIRSPIPASSVHSRAKNN